MKTPDPIAWKRSYWPEPRGKEWMTRARAIALVREANGRTKRPARPRLTLADALNALAQSAAQGKSIGA